MGAYIDKMREMGLRQYDFSNETQPKVEMPIKTAIERVQPFLAGLDAEGRMVWQGLAMPDWQMRMLPVRYLGDFRSFWTIKALHDAFGYEPAEPISSMTLVQWKKEKKHARIHHKGD